MELQADKWKNIKINQGQTLSFYFKSEGLTSDASKILYKIILNGKVYENGTNTPMDRFVDLKDLPVGVYIISIQAYVNRDLESAPEAMKFEVTKFASANSQIKQSGTDSLQSTLMLYGFIVICLIQLAVIFYFLKKRLESKRENNEHESDIASGKSERERLKIENEKLKKDNDLLKSYNSLVTEFDDLEYSYDKLKKEYTNLKELNDFLRQQVNDLKANINDLQTANAQLAKQKDRLLENKRQLEELQQQKDELFAMAVHDIKNPAAAIRSYVELLDSYDLNAQEQQEVMQSLVNTSSHIINLAQQMSLVVTKKRPDPVYNYEMGSIKKIADIICNRNKGYAVKKEVKLINQTSPNTPETKMDIAKVEEVFDNLINNAIKYAPKGTIVQVKSYFSDSKVTVEVVDNGVGLTDDDCNHVFEKGALLTPKPTDGETRSGLGLWIVKKIIEDHGGHVWVKSKVSVGSTFGFELPIKK
ncbi:MAG: ATP-binding protein [Bacteroidota bacterium]|nr:ATP-binding protein [Bacteroidota bacterium]